MSNSFDSESNSLTQQQVSWPWIQGSIQFILPLASVPLSLIYSEMQDNTHQYPNQQLIYLYTSHELTHLIFTTALWGKYYSLSSFINKGTKVQGNAKFVPGFTASLWKNQDLNPGNLALESVLLTQRKLM